jgi:tetratricopeptide (TPR) repeat protein
LANTNPDTYQPDVAMTQSNLGLLYQAKNDYPAALKLYKTALEIYERLAKNNPATYEPYVAMLQFNLGVLYEAKNDYPAALNAYGIALEIYERLAMTNPDTYEPDAAITQNNLGNLYQTKNDYPAASNAYEKAVQIYERLAKTKPATYDIEFCRNTVLLGLLQKADYHENRQKQIEHHLDKAKQILLTYSEVPIAKTLLGYVNDLNTHFTNQRKLLPIQKLQSEMEKAKNFKEKIIIQKEIIEQYRSLVNSGNSNFAYDLGANLSSLAWFYLFEKQFSEAENAASEALNPTKYGKTEGYGEKIEWANTNLALALIFQNKYQDAEKIYIALKDKPYNKAIYRDTFLADFDELEKAGITHPDIVKIKAILNKQ